MGSSNTLKAKEDHKEKEIGGLCHAQATTSRAL